jgi:hypothetical protein
MKGTFAYCRTKDAIAWMEDGDIIQHLQDRTYFKKVNSIVYFSDDSLHWEEFTTPMETFPPYEEWRSIYNLHYLKDLEHKNKSGVKYLAPNDIVLPYDDPEADKTKKRWFVGGIL